MRLSLARRASLPLTDQLEAPPMRDQIASDRLPTGTHLDEIALPGTHRVAPVCTIREGTTDKLRPPEAGR